MTSNGYLAAVLQDVISEPLAASGCDLSIVIGEELDGLAVGVLGRVVIGDRVLAVVRQVLLSCGGQQLQEA